MYHIAPDFYRFISKLPADALEGMRRYLSQHGSDSEVISKVIKSISIELLKIKWGCRR